MSHVITHRSDAARDAVGAPTLPSSSRTSTMLGALAALIVANAVQIAAGLAAIDPSPPTQVLPLLAATLAVGAAAIPMVRAGARAGLHLGLAFCSLSLIGMGPHKLLLENGLVLAPLTMTGFVFEIVFVTAAIRELRRR